MPRLIASGVVPKAAAIAGSAVLTTVPSSVSMKYAVATIDGTARDHASFVRNRGVSCIDSMGSGAYSPTSASPSASRPRYSPASRKLSRPATCIAPSER